MFTNPVMGKFFELGQVISTERGKGIYQPAVDLAIRRVEEGGWVRRVISIGLTPGAYLSRGKGQPGEEEPSWRAASLQVGSGTDSHGLEDLARGHSNLDFWCVARVVRLSCAL